MTDESGKGIAGEYMPIATNQQTKKHIKINVVQGKNIASNASFQICILRGKRQHCSCRAGHLVAILRCTAPERLRFFLEGQAQCNAR